MVYPAKKISVLITGGAGYIGSHTCVELLNAGFDVVIFDNLSNSHPMALQRVEQITGKKVNWISGDIRDAHAIESALRTHHCQAVIHFAGLKAVGESVQQPLLYYDNNVVGTLRLLEAMQTCDVKTLVFSSSATVYGKPQQLPLTETHPLSATNPYGRTKLMIEEILRDLYKADNQWRIVMLRYFNPVGAHESGLIGEDPQGIPNNLMPFISQVAVGRREYLSIWGNDYNTPDGTGVRDYIHVVDLAQGHLKALDFLQKNAPQTIALNLGTGKGFSVLEMLHAFEKNSQKKIVYQFFPRREGDVDASFANTELAEQLLNWRATKDINAMCQDTWRWQQNNPNGYHTD